MKTLVQYTVFGSNGRDFGFIDPSSVVSISHKLPELMIKPAEAAVNNSWPYAPANYPHLRVFIVMDNGTYVVAEDKMNTLVNRMESVD